MTAPALAREMPDGSRQYVNPRTGECVPSVTTILNQVAKPKLIGWSARLAAEYAVRNWTTLERLSSWGRTEAIRHEHDRVRDKASALGTAVHLAIDCWCKGKAHVHPKEVDPYMGSFVKFLMEKRPVFLRSEVTVWSREHDYAGTADALISLEDKTWMIDWKSGKSLHDEVGLQLSALSHADFIITPEGEELEMPAISALAAVHIRPRSWKFVPVNHVEENFSAFLAARALHYWSTEIAPEVLGEAA